jgi:hypothetical protein
VEGACESHESVMSLRDILAMHYRAYSTRVWERSDGGKARCPPKKDAF